MGEKSVNDVIVRGGDLTGSFGGGGQCLGSVDRDVAVAIGLWCRCVETTAEVRRATVVR